jgi:hypothetical protein
MDWPPVMPLAGGERRVGGEDLEGQRLHGIGGEDRRGLVEGAVGGGPAPAQVVVVHRRQVVVDQRECVHELDGGGRRVEPRRVDAEGLAGGVDEQWPDPLAAAEHRVAHGLVEAGRGDLGGRQAAVEELLDAGDVLLGLGTERHGGGFLRREA